MAALPEALERFGIGTLGELAALPRAALADRFGATGTARARPRARAGHAAAAAPAAERLQEVLELPESAAGPQLERALGLLIDRVLARPERRGRTLRARRALRRAGGGRHLAHAADLPRGPGRPAPHAPRAGRPPHELPAPADALRLRVEAFGPPAGDQRSLLAEPAAIRLARLREAVRQARAVAGPDAALRILR